MKLIQGHCFVLLALLSLNVLGQPNDTTFKKVYNQIEEKNFFKAKELYDLNKNDLSSMHQIVVEVFLDNSFNLLEQSNKKISHIVESKSPLPDSLYLELYKIKEDNSVKLFDYQEAKNTLHAILANYKNLLSEDEMKDMENNLKIWTALEHEPKQRVTIKATTTLKMTKDKAGLNNLKIFAGTDSVNFIFDTGANLSTISESTAKKSGMKIIPVDIAVGTITGKEVLAQLALCPLLRLGNIEIRHAVFLVLKDSLLSFSQIDYQINGILGFPVIEALHEIQLTQDNYFIVPKEKTKIEQHSNMAMNGLTPLIYIDGRHFTFDTGADKTILYHAFYTEEQKEIHEKYEPTKINFAGAGGTKEFDGYIISPDFNVLNKRITLKDVQLLKNKINENETVYGNIGQDLIKQFNKMTLNFDQMFIKFD